MPIRRADIKSLATYVPPRVLTNADLEKMVETTDEWIMQRTGIRERHIVDPGVATSDLAKEAALEAISRAGPHARRHRRDHRRHGDAGHAVPEHRVPGAGQDRRDQGVGLRSVGGVLGVHLRADGRQPDGGLGRARTNVLVIGADVMSSIIDYTDRATCVLFGDGAGRGGARRVGRSVRRHPRLRAPGRRQRRAGAVHAGRRQQAARPRTRPSTSACTT